MAGLAGVGAGKYEVGPTVSQERCAPRCLEPRPVMKYSIQSSGCHSCNALGSGLCGP